MDEDLLRRLRRHLVSTGLVAEGGTALLAVSGGGDSVALAVLLHALAPEFDLGLVIGHVDHGIALDSATAAAGVERLAARLGVPYGCRQLGLGPDASETVARTKRYAALRDMQREAGGRYLVTAHQADDQVETVLARVLRGSGLAGLAGIPAQGPHGLIRPLLPFSRRELEGYLATSAGSEPWPVHADPANQDPRHDRSWLRGTVLPLLRGRFGDVADRRLLSLGRHAARERDAWGAALRALPDLALDVRTGHAEVARAPLASYDNALSEALLRAVAREAGCLLGPARARRLVRWLRETPSGGVFEIGSGWRAELAFDRVRLVADTVRVSRPPLQLVLEGEGAAEWDGWRLAWRAEPVGVVQRASFVTWVRPGRSTVRGPRPGDRLVPLGGVGRRKARRLLMEQRVPAPDRRRYPVLVREESVLWVPGVCRSADGVPGPDEPAVRMEVTRAGP